MEIIYDKKEMESLCKDLLYEVNDLKQYTDVAVDKQTIDTEVQLTAVRGARNNISEIDRILFLVETMLENRKGAEYGNRCKNDTIVNNDSNSRGYNN